MWVITGDGDGLSIGGNHLMHAIRRNLDINIILFNNQIYGLTKGQYSPTSPLGKVTKSTPCGSVDNPVHPLSVGTRLRSDLRRPLDRREYQTSDDGAQTRRRTRGTSFVEVYQNCNVFNDGAFEWATNRDTRADQVVEMEHGKPLIFGKKRDKGIRLNGMQLEVVDLGKASPKTICCSTTNTNPTPPWPFFCGDAPTPSTRSRSAFFAMFRGLSTRNSSIRNCTKPRRSKVLAICRPC